MTAWAISTVVGDGQFPSRLNPTSLPYTPTAAQYGSYVCLIPGNPDGSPRKSWCLVRLGDDADLVAADADPGVIVLDEGDMNRTLNAGAANQVNSRLAATGVDTRATAGMTVRQVLQALCDELGDPAWGPVA